MNASFHNVRFPPAISLGAVGGPERKVDIVRLRNGAEYRNVHCRHSKRVYEAGSGIKTKDELFEILSFFEARGGSEYGFLWKDWLDFSSGYPSHDIGAEDEILGVGDNETTIFPLVKHYRSGDGDYLRPIRKPVLSTLLVAIDGTERVEGMHYSFDDALGSIVFQDPVTSGATVTAGFEFDVPVRFDCEKLDISLSHFDAGEVLHIPLVEVLL